jgi:hypothetical protein
LELRPKKADTNRIKTIMCLSYALKYELVLCSSILKS